MTRTLSLKLLSIAAITLLTGCTTTPTSLVENEDAQVRTVVEAFGKSLKQVSLTAEPQVASKAITNIYAPYLTSTLLNSWALEPDLALGKVTSSPWPERIEITQMTKSTDTEYHVMGNVIQVTSDTLNQEHGASQDPIDLIVQKVHSEWLINEAKLLDTVQTTQATYEGNGISVKYPTTLSTESGTGIGGGNLDTTLIKFMIPAEIVASEGTNFNEAYLLLSSSNKSTSLKTCLNYGDLGPGNKTVATSFNNVAFSRLDTTDAAAGNRYNTQLYRAIDNNTCYELALVVHTGNIQNYDPPVKEFDATQATQILMPIISSVTFIN